MVTWLSPRTLACIAWVPSAATVGRDAECDHALSSIAVQVHDPPEQPGLHDC